MENLFKITIYSYLLMCICVNVYSQATQVGAAGAGHSAGGPAANYYVGWDNSTIIPLEIRQDNTAGNAQDIDFYTNGGQRMTIRGTNSTDNGFIGIATASPSSVLHIDGNATTTKTGETFRTTGPSNIDQRWRMFTGSTEIFRIENNASALPNGLSLRGLQNGSMRLWTNDVSRLCVVAGTGVTAGYVGVGNSFTTPASRFHIYQNSTSGTATENDVWLQLTTHNTNATSGDGLRIGIIDASGNVEIKQQESADMLFSTNGSERMRILSGGNVGIGITSPASKLHVFSAPNSASSVDGAIIEFTNATASGLDRALSVLSTVTAGTSENRGIQSTVGGAIACSGFYAHVDNSDAAAQVNFGYNCNITDNNAGTSSAANTGYYCSIPSPANIAATVNRGFTSQIGQSGSSYSLGTIVGTSITNFNAVTNYGVSVSLTKTNDNYTAGTWYGVYSNSGFGGSASVGATNNYAGFFAADGGTNENYGVYAAGGSGCTSTSCPNAAGYFSGDVIVNGEIYEASDGFLKDNIQPLNNVSSILNQLHPKTYTFKTQYFPSMHLSSANQYGLIAEDVQQILPDLVHQFSEPAVKDSQGNVVTPQVDFKALNYTELIPLLIAGFKEQQVHIHILQARIEACCANSREGQNIPNSGSIELEDMATLQLLQNDPNPFSESTMIRWNVPNDFQNAVIYFYDNSGNQINSYKVNSKGAGELQIFGSRLSSGIYTYSLVVDGKVIDSKKMVKTK